MTEVGAPEAKGIMVQEIPGGDARGEIAAVPLNADFALAMNRLVPDLLRRRWTNRKLAGKILVPVTIVPGDLTDAQIDAIT